MECLEGAKAHCTYCPAVSVFVAHELLALQVRDGSIEVRPRLVALDVQDSKAHFSDGTSVHVRLLDTVTAYKRLYE